MSQRKRRDDYIIELLTSARKNARAIASYRFPHPEFGLSYWTFEGLCDTATKGQCVRFKTNGKTVDQIVAA